MNSLVFLMCELQSTLWIALGHQRCDLQAEVLLSRLRGLHHSRFSSLFRDTLDVCFAQFRRRAQLAQVAHLLLTARLSSEVIAEQAGFVDASHMHRAFVRTFGYTPGEYCRRNRGS